MNGWSTEKLATLVNIVYGKSPSAIEKLDEGFPIFGTGGIVGYTSEFLCEGPSVILGRKGTIDKVQKCTGPFWAIDTTYYTTPKREFCWSWLYYTISSFDLRKLNEASGVPSLSRSSLEALDVAVPPLPQQQKIAVILKTVDDKLDVIVRQIETTQTLKQGLMQTLFSRGVGTQDTDGRWVPHAEFKDSELGEVPVGWEVVHQGVVATFFNGRAYKLTEWEETGTPVIRLQNLTGSGDKYYYSTLNLPEHQYANNGDLLYMWSASFGPYIWQGEKAIYHYHIWKVECGERLDKLFMYYSLVWLTTAMKSKTHGSTMMHLTKAGMEKYPMVLPPLAEQRQIARILSTVDSKIEVLTSRQTEVMNLKRGLMQKLLTGEWRVRVDAAATEP
ncbi:restriction endonuclease subunit S [Comamonas jiangduensis]|uniref:restriction endonuclease subunit S n=1 Tax=Comamonas jiangduensis TaxID=1194168 RepID=UPI0028A90EAC|nr:restriction endonuclease subunit S [Comamonas jiangduensis]